MVDERGQTCVPVCMYVCICDAWCNNCVLEPWHDESGGHEELVDERGQRCVPVLCVCVCVCG